MLQVNFSPDVNERIIFWLLPDRKQSKFLQELIDQLADLYNGPSFPPHLTLKVLPTEAEQDWQYILQTICQYHHPLSFDITGEPQSEENFKQALYLPLSSHSGLSAIINDISHTDTTGKDSEPHLSLYYGAPENLPLHRLRRESSLPFSTIIFDRCCAVQIGAQTESAADVENWQVLAIGRLGQC